MTSDSLKLIIAGAVGIAIGVVLIFLPFFKRIELNYFDFLQLVSLSDSSADVAVVELDKKTTDMLGWPVGRDIYAAVVNIVSESGAKRIGFDLFLDSRAGGEDREDIFEAELMLGEIVNETDAVLASYVTEVESETVIEDRDFFPETSRKNNYFCDIESLPENRVKVAKNSYLKQLVPGIRQHDVNLAHVHVIPSDIDGVYRSITPCYPVFDGCIRDLGLYLTGKTPDPEKCMEAEYIPYFRKYEDVPSMSMA
ncbi:MAG: CHASE2 domain-containing protein, partial [bacterium]